MAIAALHRTGRPAAASQSFVCSSYLPHSVVSFTRCFGLGSRRTAHNLAHGVELELSDTEVSTPIRRLEPIRSHAVDGIRSWGPVSQPASQETAFNRSKAGHAATCIQLSAEIHCTQMCSGAIRASLFLQKFIFHCDLVQGGEQCGVWPGFRHEFPDLGSCGRPRLWDRFCNWAAQCGWLQRLRESMQTWRGNYSTAKWGEKQREGKGNVDARVAFQVNPPIAFACCAKATTATNKQAAFPRCTVVTRFMNMLIHSQEMFSVIGTGV